MGRMKKHDRSKDIIADIINAENRIEVARIKIEEFIEVLMECEGEIQNKISVLSEYYNIDSERKGPWGKTVFKLPKVY
jgi:hypothetical protein